MIYKQAVIKRAGITITEALASIAIAATGLFAVLAIIPFAARQTEAGLDLDVAVSVGKNAVHDFDVRGMGRVSNWRLAYVPPDPSTMTVERNNVIPASSYWVGKPVVIDPLFINQNLDLISIPGTPSPTSPTVTAPEIIGFPYALYDVVQANSRAIDRLNMAANGTAYNYSQSEGIFRSVNELVFNNPTNDLDNPIQSINRDGTVDLKRDYQGKISWMAMVVPETDVFDEVNPHMYRLYVIVFRNRQLTYRHTDPTGEAVFSTTSAGSGIGGGSYDFQVVDGALQQDDYLNNGDWVLFTDFPVDNKWRWYQISRVNPPQKDEQIKLFRSPSGMATVTVQGADWSGSTSPTAIVMSNVISVYEKTIRIEYDSIWNE